VMWNPRSVMFEVGWCVALYTTVLALEFSPVVFTKLGWERPLGWAQKAMIPLVIAGVILSTLHQSSLGSLYLIVPHRLHALWYTPLLPVLFFVSALAAGLAMTIFESWLSSRAFGRALEAPLLASLGKALAVTLALCLALRIADLAWRGALPLALKGGTESAAFGLETLLILVPALLLWRRGIRENPRALYGCAVLVIAGFVANRLNVSITGMLAASSVPYLPKWTEVAATVAMVAAGVALFGLAARWLPVFEESEPGLLPRDGRKLEPERTSGV